MKKNLLALTLLAMCMTFASCGKKDDARGIDTLDVIEDSGRPESGGDVPENGKQSEAGGDAGAQQPEGGNAVAEEGNSDAEKKAADEQALKEQAAAGGELEDTEAEETVFLSSKILKAGETMEILYPNDESVLEKGLEVTLRDAKLNDSPEEAQLDRALMEDRAENYNLSGEPWFCGIDEARILTCDLTVKNVNVEHGDSLHVSEIMVAYVDPATGKVSLLTCMPVYFSASSSNVGASDYYHYSVPKGESKDMTVAWLVPEEYEAENLYLGVVYDVRESQERQYFRLF